MNESSKSPNFSEFFWSQKQEGEESERSRDLLGFTNLEDEISDILLPGLNKRVYRAKYLLLSSFILWTIKHDKKFGLEESSDSWARFCENWFTLGLFKYNAKQFQDEYSIIGKRSKKIKSSKDIYSKNFLISNQEGQGPYATYKRVSENFEEESNSPHKSENKKELNTLRKLKNLFLRGNEHEKLAGYFYKKQIPDMGRFRSIFTMRLTPRQEALLEEVLKADKNRKLLYEIVQTGDNIDVLLKLQKTRLKDEANIALQYHDLVAECIECFRKICKHEAIDFKGFKSKLDANWKNPLLDFVSKKDNELYKFLDLLSRTNNAEELKKCFIERHIQKRPDRLVIYSSGMTTELGQTKESFGNPPTFRLDNFRSLVRDIKNGL